MSVLDDHGGWPGLLATLASGDDITSEAAEAALSAILAGEATDAQISGLIVALRLKGESVDELTGMVRGMLGAATPLELPDDTIDIVGMGGAPSRRTHALNVSTMAALVAAAAGATVCKHGNRRISSTSGSFDLLEAMSLNIELSPERLQDVVRETGLGFAFARTFHPAMRHVGPVRAELGIPTVFNILGPLSHPGRVRRQVIGVADASLAPKMAAVLQATGSERTMVVHGDGQLDELTTTGPSHVVELRDGDIREYDVTPAEVGLAQATADDLLGGDAEANAKIFNEILDGQQGARRDIVVLNAAAGLGCGRGARRAGGRRGCCVGSH